MQRIKQGVHPISFLGLLILEPLEMQRRTGRLHGTSLDTWVGGRFGSCWGAGSGVHDLEKI